MMLVIGAAWSLLAAFDLWLILIRPDAAWQTRVAFLLGVVGIYSFAFGVVAGSGLLDWSPRLGRDLTGPHPTLLLAGIFTVLGVVFSAAALAIGPKKTAESFDRRGGMILPVLQTPVIFLIMIVLIPFALVYVFLVAPLAWIAYAIVGAPLDSILMSGPDTEITMSDSQTDLQTITIKKLVDDHLVTLRNALVAVPALVSSFVLTAHKLI